MNRPALINPLDLGRAVKAERRAQGRTQQALAEAAGYRRQTIVDLERGRNVSTHTLLAALSALGKGLSIVDKRLELEQLHTLLDEPDGQD